MDRDLEAGTTQVVSTLPNGSTIAAGTGVAALDGLRGRRAVLIGRLVKGRVRENGLRRV
jgi:hypothetical protein